MNRKQQGFSLLELLLVCGLSLFLLTGILACYLANQKNYALIEALIRMQESGRIAMHLLAHDIRMAGYVGCGRLSDIAFINPNAINFSSDTRLMGWHKGRSTGNYPLPTLLSKVLMTGSDVLLLQKMSAATQEIKLADGLNLQLTDTTSFSPDDLLLVADCEQVEVARVATQKRTSILLQTPLIGRYNHAVVIGHLQQIVYYVAKTDRQDVRGNAIYALYRRDLNLSSHVPSELIEGVDNMQIEWGIKNSQTGGIHYFTADTVPDWRNVTVVQLALLLDSIQPVVGYVLHYRFAGKQYSANDGHLRREWDATIALREALS